MKKIILISGKQGSGKTTLSGLLSKKLRDLGYVPYPVKFAAPLYKMHDFCLDVLKDHGVTRDIVKDGPLLQLLGTEWGRKTISQNIWAKLAQNHSDNILQRDEKAVIIIDDCRFPNEFDTFPDALKVRLNAPQVIRKDRAEMWRENTEHPSETSLDQYAEEGRFDLNIDTSKTDENEMTNLVIKHLEFQQ